MFKEFIMKDIFHKVELKRIKKTFNKVNDISKEQTRDFCLPLINAKNGDNGIMYYGRMSDWESDTYCIDIINDGAVSTGNVYAQPQRTGVLYNAYMIKPNKVIESTEILLFLAKTIEKAIKRKFGYDNKATWEKVKVMGIALPIIENSNPNHEYTVDDIDWEYMRNYITELEHDRITELDAYLKASNLNDYELTETDKKVLSEKPSYTSFTIDSVFYPLKVGFVGKGKKIGSATKEPDEEHCIPLTCAKIGDNGVMYWGKKGDFITYTNTLSVIADGAISAGLVYAQPEEAGAYSHSYFIDTKEKNVSKYAKQFLSTVLTKVVYPKYSREDTPRWNKIEKDIIYLPSKSDGTPDFNYMENYIRAIEKLVIADVVKYKNKVIEETRKVVNK